MVRLYWSSQCLKEHLVRSSPLAPLQPLSPSPLPPFSPLTVHLSFPLFPALCSGPPRFLLPSTFTEPSVRFPPHDSPDSFFCKIYYLYTLIRCATFTECVHKTGEERGPVINQELVPSGHFIRVVEMRTNEEYYTATVMRQSFRFNFVYALAVLFPQKKRTNRSVQDVRIRTKFLSSPSPPPFLFLPAR